MVVPIGMLTSLDISLSNTSLIYIPISLYTTVKASVLVYTFAFRYFTLLLSYFFIRIIYYFRLLPNSLQFCQLHDIIIFQIFNSIIFNSSDSDLLFSLFNCLYQFNLFFLSYHVKQIPRAILSFCNFFIFYKSNM